MAAPGLRIRFRPNEKPLRRGAVWTIGAVSAERPGGACGPVDFRDGPNRHRLRLA